MTQITRQQECLPVFWLLICVIGAICGSLLTGFRFPRPRPARYTHLRPTRLLARRPEKIIEEAVKGMLPKSKMGRQMGTKLKVYKGDKHPHEAQMPEVLEVIA